MAQQRPRAGDAQLLIQGGALFAHALDLVEGDAPQAGHAGRLRSNKLSYSVYPILPAFASPTAW